jgi:DNA-directed RNA polymerase specialized sigma24 family protein
LPPNADLKLVRQVAAGERDAFDVLFDRYADRVHLLAHRRVAGLDSARDLTERMLERVFSDLAHYQGDVSLDWWVLGRCKRVLVDSPTVSEPRTRAESGEEIHATVK